MRNLLFPLVAFAVALPAVSASADATPQTLPFTQNWSNPALITTANNWGSVPGIIGYQGEDSTTTTGGTDPQTIVTPAASSTMFVLANQTSVGVGTGGPAEFDMLADPVVAIQGSNAADYPNLIIHLNTTGMSSVVVRYVLRDIDVMDNAVQPVALQYRVGSTGNFINVPGGFVADAATAGGATQVTPVSATLPVSADNQALIPRIT